jgi:hypothetical protein
MANPLMSRSMTIERPDLRRDNHSLLRRVQEVWQLIENGIMITKVKVVCRLFDGIMVALMIRNEELVPPH